MVKEGERHTVTVENWASDGSGVARIGSLAVFVKGGIPGERCVIEIEHVGHSAAWAHITELLEPSPACIVPDCPHFGTCGGCQLRHMDYETELAFKRQKVSDALRRIGGLDVDVPPVLGAAERSHYRNKAQFPVGPGPRVGFYRERSHAVVDVDGCALQSPAANALANALRTWMREHNVPAYDEKSRKGLVRHLFVRSSANRDCLAAVVVNGKGLPFEAELVETFRAAAPPLVGVVLNENRRDTNVILGSGWRTLWGASTLPDTLRGVTFRLSVPAFYQVNHTQTEVLYALAEEFAALTGEERLLDLYCGTGTIGLTMASKCKSLLGAEIVPQAVEDAKENAARNGVKNARFVCADAAEVAAELARTGEAIDVAIVDPPRKGLSPDVVESLLKIAPKRIVYVSCDPATLARDLKPLTASYTVEKVQSVDLFPRTFHVETVCLLTKLKVDKHIEVDLDLSELDVTSAESKATYDEIKAYVLERFGLKVSSLYISQVKRKCGLEVGQNYNPPKSDTSRQPQCPPEKEAAIRAALEHFGMI